jgi:sulfur-oxidizing protein SoxX
MHTIQLPAVPALVVTACGIIGCASMPSSSELDQQARAAIKASFRDQGIAKVDRLNQDLGQRACSGPTPPSPRWPAHRGRCAGTIKWPEPGATSATGARARSWRRTAAA